VPTLKITSDVPLVETPVNITVTRFAQDGIDVKSTDVGPPETGKGFVPPAFTVPDVITLLAIADTTAPVMVGLVSVLLVRVCVAAKPTIVSVIAGNVIVLVPETAAGETVI